jgi:hypothetical protein
MSTVVLTKRSNCVVSHGRNVNEHIMIKILMGFFGFFLPLEEYVGTSNLTVGALSFVAILCCMLQFSSKFVCLSFVEHDVPTVIKILECYYVN